MLSAIARGVVLAASVVLSACGGGGGTGGAGGGTGVNAAPPDDDRDTVANASDCAPSDASSWQLLDYASLDADSDQKRINSSGRLCSGATLPAGYSVNAAPQQEIDCDDASASRWQMLAYQSVDLDADSYFVAASGTLCAGAQLPSTHRDIPAAAALADCLDEDRSRWRLIATFADADHDGIGSGPRVTQCAGIEPPVGFSFRGYDPLDDPNDGNSALVADFDIQSGLLTTP